MMTRDDFGELRQLGDKFRNVRQLETGCADNLLLFSISKIWAI